MNKKKYQKPIMQVVEIQEASIVCTSDTVINSIKTNEGVGIGFGGRGNGPARRPTRDTWDDGDWDD
ncbi:MAG: hypothetical protein IJV06_09810 [Bacteroidaceae bacterium]|nr:hypothetical protein [Bacteroidaceae bacterium]